MANATQHDDEGKELLPTAHAPPPPNTTTRSYAIRAWAVGVLAVPLFFTWIYSASVLLQVKELGNWPDVPYSTERAKLLAVLCYLSLAAAVLLTAGAVFAVFSLHEAAQPRNAKENVSRGAKALTAITVTSMYVIGLYFLTQPDETCEGKLQTIVRIPDSLALPVTATVYSAQPTCTGRSCAPRFSIDDTDSVSDTGPLLQFALTDSELSITRDTNNSFRALYDFQRGSAVASFLPTNASDVINSTATFSHTKLAMHVALPLPWNRTVSITHPDWNIFTPPTPRNEIMLRAVNRGRGRMCIAPFDRNNVEELAPLALPLGLVMHSARPQTPRSAWRMMRQSLWS